MRALELCTKTSAHKKTAVKVEQNKKSHLTPLNYLQHVCTLRTSCRQEALGFTCIHLTKLNLLATNYQQCKGICLVNSLISWWILYSERSISKQTVANCLEFHHILSRVLSASSCPINLTVHTYWLLMTVGLCAWEGARFTLERLWWCSSASTTC